MKQRMVDLTCTCGEHFWEVDRGGGPMLGCPTCDRPRCGGCGQPYGQLFAPVAMPKTTTRCDACAVVR